MPDGESADSPDLLPARMLNEFTYCPRLFYLEWVQGEFSDSADTLDGHRVHRRVDEEKGAAPAPEEWTEGLKVRAKAISVSSARIGMVAKLDLLEDEGRQVCPVDYKRGHGPEGGDGLWDADRIQLGVQLVLLRDSGYPCERGYVYYAETKKRVPLAWSDDLERRILETVSEARRISGEMIPPPLIDSPKCPRCSLVGICLPDEVRALSETSPQTATIEVRQLLAPRDDALPLYVLAQGAMVAKSGEVLEIRQREEKLAKARLLEISQVCLFGSVMVTAGALHELLERGIPVCHFSHGGWFYGFTHGFSHKNVQLRLDQFRIAESPSRSIAIARQMVSGKVRNCRTLLRRNHEADVSAALEELARLLDLVESTTSAETLLAMEGAAAKTYFAHFAGMLKTKDDESATSFDFSARNRRPPVDPVNALLSFLYAILAKDTTVTLQSVGFDPMLGFFHKPRYGRPSLALDLMEEFRPIIVDSTVISLINNKEVVPSDFVRRAGAVAMNGDGRKKVLGAYERRMSTEVAHPIFGYTVSYRRVLEIQARLLSRHVMGEIPTYQPFCTR